jgi:hypothetical protein
MEGQSVLAQNKQKAPESKAEKPAEGASQSVLGGNSTHKPVTFYKKAWFWIIIAVVVLGVAGLIVFLVINANLEAEAIAKYDKNVDEAYSAKSEFDNSFYSLYNEAGLTGYYDSGNKRAKEVRGKCIEKFGGDEKMLDAMEGISDYWTIRGEEAVEKYGSGKVRELSETYEKAATVYRDAKAKITDCKGLLEDAINSDIKVTFGEFKVVEGRWSNDTSMKITIKNMSDTSHKFTFYVEAQDENGDKIDDDYVYTKTLSAGEETEDTIFKYVYSSKIEKMKTAKFVVKKLHEY